MLNIHETIIQNEQTFRENLTWCEIFDLWGVSLGVREWGCDPVLFFH